MKNYSELYFFTHGRADVTVCVVCAGRLRLEQLCTRPSEIARAEVFGG